MCTPIAWLTSGMPTSAWLLSTCRARRLFMSRELGAAWASGIPTRTCWASCRWFRRARERILDLAATQLPSGGAYHQYQPLTKRGNNDVGSNFNDDPHWLIVGVAAYLKETGDWSILDEPVT